MLACLHLNGVCEMVRQKNQNWATEEPRWRGLLQNLISPTFATPSMSHMQRCCDFRQVRHERGLGFYPTFGSHHMGCIELTSYSF